jgi:glycosyltransferase involved in cell wall biosynthesis
MQENHISSAKPNPAAHPPLVSIITPFYNTERYIAQCIESVVAQTYSNWEYILVNNQSSDSSRKIADSYACGDSRIRLLDTPRHFGQIENFNAALKYMSAESRYCKVVLADDWIFPECVEKMVALAEVHPSIGIVSSYRLFGDEITGDGLPYASQVIPGRKACQHILRDGLYLTGAPTAVLVRSDIVRKEEAFYPEGWLHDDTEACFRILAKHDLGFIHQVLTFSRKDEESLTSEVARFGPGPIRKFMFAVKYGPGFFTGHEYARYLKRETDFYGQFLAESAFQFKPKEFWDFHRRGLRVVGADFWSIGLPKYVLLEFLDIIFNPKKTVGRILRLVKNSQLNSKGSKAPVPSPTKEHSTSL